MQVIEQGARVRVRTTNGGEAVGILESRYVETFGLDLVGFPREISPWRIASVEVLEPAHRPVDAAVVIRAIEGGVEVACSECRHGRLEARDDHARCDNCDRVWIAA